MREWCCIRKPEVSSQSIPILSTVRTFYSSKTIHTCTNVNLRCSALNVFPLPPFFLPFWDSASPNATIPCCLGSSGEKKRVWVMHLKVWSKLEEHNGKELNYQGWTGDSLEEMPHKKFSVLELGWSNIFKAWLHTGWLWGIWYCLINLHCLWTVTFGYG